MIGEHGNRSPVDHLIYLMHLAAYQFADRFTHDKRVLDYGCGTGYGTARIAGSASEVIGVDIAPDAVMYAANHFRAANLRFERVASDRALPFADGYFDTVLSFQVLEHVRDPQSYLSEVRRVLASSGTLILATPDRSTRLLPFQRPWNRWHFEEYDQHGLRRQLRRVFGDVVIYGMGGQRNVIAIELRRCRTLKWLTLPFTLPIVPDAFRIATLNALHRFRGRGKRFHGPPSAHDFDIEDIHIALDARPSLNLVAVASGHASEVQSVPQPDGERPEAARSFAVRYLASTGERTQRASSSSSRSSRRKRQRGSS